MHEKNEFKERVEEELETVEDALKAHGGNIKLVKVDEKKGIVFVELVGECRTCPMANLTLKMGVEDHLKSQIPEVKEVRAINFEKETKSK
jgi:Fe-S cluster biogenesis protein NfuA